MLFASWQTDAVGDITICTGIILAILITIRVWENSHTLNNNDQ